MYKTKEEMSSKELLYLKIYGTTSGYYDKNIIS